MSPVVRILEPRDDRIGGSNQLGELLLGETGFRAEGIDVLGDSSVELRLGERALALRALEKQAVQDLQTIRCLALTLDHVQTSYERAVGSASKAILRRTARSISIGGTAACCFTMPWETTTAVRPWKKYKIR